MRWVTCPTDDTTNRRVWQIREYYYNSRVKQEKRPNENIFMNESNVNNITITCRETMTERTKTLDDINLWVI